MNEIAQLTDASMARNLKVRTVPRNSAGLVPARNRSDDNVGEGRSESRADVDATSEVVDGANALRWVNACGKRKAHRSFRPRLRTPSTKVTYPTRETGFLCRLATPDLSLSPAAAAVIASI